MYHNTQDICHYCLSLSHFWCTARSASYVCGTLVQLKAARRDTPAPCPPGLITRGKEADAHRNLSHVRKTRVKLTDL